MKENARGKFVFYRTEILLSRCKIHASVIASFDEILRRNRRTAKMIFILNRTSSDRQRGLICCLENNE